MDHWEAGRKGESDLIPSGQRRARGVRQKQGTQDKATGSSERASDQNLSAVPSVGGVGDWWMRGSRWAGDQGGFMKGHAVYRKSTPWEEAGSSPHSLIKLCDLGHGLHWTSVFPLKNGEFGQICKACSLEISNRVVVRCGALVPESLGLNPGSSPYYYDNCVILNTHKC